MTNKPMLSVERDKFESLYRAEVERQGKNFEPVIFRLDDKGDYFIGLVQAAWWGYQQIASRPEPGPPVAWWHNFPSGEYMILSNDDYHNRTILDDEYQPLYAEQPAPVAMMIPRKLNPESLYPDQSDCGWNDCIDEVCRLNGIKP